MNPADRTPRQRLDADSRRQAILDAARGVFAAKSFAEASMAQVAEAAGASQALVFHYFGSKAGLYTALVEDAAARLRASQLAADEALYAGVPIRDRVRASLGTLLEEVSANPRAWAPQRGAEEPATATDVRQSFRADEVARLRVLLDLHEWARFDYALWGYFGFLDAACLAWVDAGCPDGDREPLIAAALGALEGALGDWRI